MKKAFTLAEVLITLGIIGVVAAITMPVLITGHKEAVLKNQFKVAASLISQAHSQIIGREGYLPACYYYSTAPNFACMERNESGTCAKYKLKDTNEEISRDDLAKLRSATSGCSEMFTELKKSLKIARSCDQAQDCLSDSNGNFPYHGLDTIVESSFSDDMSDEQKTHDVNVATSGCSGFNLANLKKTPALVLSNGMIYMPYYYSSSYKDLRTFLIDINGLKGPNKWGHDLFSFYLVGTDSNVVVKPVGDGKTLGCGGVEDKGRSSFGMWKEAFGK